MPYTGEGKENASGGRSHTVSKYGPCLGPSRPGGGKAWSRQRAVATQILSIPTEQESLNCKGAVKIKFK